MGTGEEEKSAETLLAMAQQCMAGGVSKRSVVIALGGGVVLNVAGLLAALVYRGIRLVHVPTTLMAQHDVITSLKTAVNLCGRKNNFGTYYASILNLVDVGYLRTLPKPRKCTSKSTHTRTSKSPAAVVYRPSLTECL
jgi:3-dehydroquinate synthase/2-deoxy-scyllo-inosose synthase